MTSEASATPADVATSGRVPLDALDVPRRSGAEPFTEAGAPAGATLADFWGWACSDVVGNRLRGVLAEYIVALALEVHEGVRTEWDAVDLVLPSRLKVEVKSAAYLQSWSQRQPSAIKFTIARAKGWDARTNVVAATPERPSDVYVFCLLHHTDKRTIDPLNLDQWEFYVTSTAALEAAFGDRTQISLAALRTIVPVPVPFGGLKDCVLSCQGSRKVVPRDVRIGFEVGDRDARGRYAEQ
ncbi:hypothetical protein ACIBF7_40245 [Nonomuraea sp. NPDC050478]|uniref:hypothetical protein n=1 Tax=Nonomuraea sp. NPDC050478 TaxID=3364365 RepID=UPI00378FD0A4